MKSLYFLVIILCWVKTGISSPIKNHIKVENFFKSRCLKNANEEVYVNLMSDDTQQCILDTFNLFDPKENYVKTVCTQFAPAFYKCLDSFMKKLEVCLDSEEKYLVDYILQVQNISMEKRCSDDGKDLNDILAKLKQGECDVPGLALAFMVYRTCSPELKLIQNAGKPDFVIRKADLCSDMEIAKECTIKNLRQHCGDSTAFVENAKFAFDVYLTPCSE